MPGGYLSTDGAFYYVGDDGYWWTATEHGSSNAYYRDMNYYNDYVNEDDDHKSSGYSVRCVQDN